MAVDQIQYSEKYYDQIYEYRHVIVPQEIAKNVPKTHLMSETEWRNLGVQQSVGWVHYMLHAPEPHVLLFRRPRTETDIPTTTTEQVEQPTEMNVVSYNTSTGTMQAGQ